MYREVVLKIRHTTVVYMLLLAKHVVPPTELYYNFNHLKNKFHNVLMILSNVK